MRYKEKELKKIYQMESVRSHHHKNNFSHFKHYLKTAGKVKETSVRKREVFNQVTSNICGIVI